MRTSTAIVFAALAFVVTGAAGAATPSGNQDRGGLVYRYYAGVGYRFQPLLTFANLQTAVSRRDTANARRLARALLARGVRKGGAIYWPYDFSFGGGPSSWTSGFTQAVAANALARAGMLLRDDTLETAAARAFAGLRRTLLFPMAGGGLWIREYSYTGQVILNAQLESVLELRSYAAIAKTPSALTSRASSSARRRVSCAVRSWLLGPVPAGRSGGRHALRGVPRRSAAAAGVDLPRPIWRATYLGGVGACAERRRNPGGRGDS